ncbi:MAG: TetR/AcrR family transcriptional regulator [candidate division NC10 bacterium]|nr:TetR/AcrR family transcriptional regulator [candidate division NC10 bacterium]
MAKRAALAAETRRRIVDAAVALHAERGVLAAKPADIAAQADVALTTYYKHFPTIGDLVRACTTRGREVIPPPDLSALRALPPDPALRIEAMVRTLYQYYEAREPWLYAGRALVDFWAWRILRREVGLTREEVIRSVTEAAKRVAGVGRPGHRPGRTAHPRG